MKFSWIVVFGLSALSIAIGAHSFGIYMDAKLSASQVAGANRQLAKMRTRTAELVTERDKLAADIEEKSDELCAAQIALAEEKRTHAPLRKQIEEMNGSGVDLNGRITLLNKTVAELRQQLAAANQKLAAAGADAKLAKELEAEVKAMSGKLSAAQSALDGERQRNTALTNDLASAKQKAAQLDEARGEADTRSAKLLRDLAASRDKVQQLQKEIEEARDEKTRLSKEVSRLKKESVKTTAIPAQ